VIRYHRGHIAVLDRQRLEQATCECYAVAKHEYARMLPVRSRRPMLVPVPALVPVPILMPVAA
jgi:hypothetical protein